MKIKDLPVKIKAGPGDNLEPGQFVAYASVFGNVDSYGDIVERGAFANTLKEWAQADSQLPVLWGHDMSSPFSNIGHVVEAVEDEKGLRVTAQLDLADKTAEQVYRLLMGKRVNQMSFAYDVLNAPEQNEAGANLLKELKLYEVSVVPIGANQETEVLAVKTAVDVLTATTAKRDIPAKCEADLRAAYTALGAVLDTTTDNQEKASGTGPANDEGSDVKSDEPSPSPSAKTLATLSILSLT